MCVGVSINESASGLLGKGIAREPRMVATLSVKGLVKSFAISSGGANVIRELPRQKRCNEACQLC